MLGLTLILPALTSLAAIAPQDLSITLKRLEVVKGLGLDLSTKDTFVANLEKVLDSALIPTQLDLDVAHVGGLELKNLDAVKLGLVLE